MYASPKNSFLEYDCPNRQYVPDKVMQVTEIEQLEQAIKVLEAQRASLGDAVVDAALGPLREKLLSLQPQTAEQRKMVTILFADLVGFTAMSSRLDAEDMREILNSYFSRWTACIEARGGLVEKFIGDAVMAIFGLPNSSEDDPESAIRAALEMRAGLEELNTAFNAQYGIQLAMRVGIHTGQVVVSFLGERKGQDFVVVGDAVNLTSRLQSAAPEDGILITHDTYRHVRGSFDVHALSPIQVKGKEEPIQAYQVIQAKRRSFRGPTRGVEGIDTPLVGRDSELVQLKEALRLAIQARKTQVITVAGEAGVGKSRLITEFDNWVETLPQRIRYFRGRSSPSMQNLPYSLLRDMFSFSFQIYDSDPPQVVQEKIERGIGEFEFDSAETPSFPSESALPHSSALPETQMRAHFIGHLLGFRFENSPYLRSALQDPRGFRDRALMYLINYFKALVAVVPVILLLEDLHWADDASLDILKRIWEGLADEPLLLVCTTRPALYENYPEWGKEKEASSVGFARIQLVPLSPHNSQHLVDEILKKVEDIPDFLRDLVVDRAEGNPFFIEELIKMLIEEQVILIQGEHWRVDLSNLAAERIPSTLVEVLQARLDGLSVEERVLLQRASVVGRIFWDDAIRFMEKGQEDQVLISPQMKEILRNLSAKEMVFTHPASIFEDTREFYFIHALLRDVTYDNVLKRLRKIYHGYAAAWLETTTEQSRRSGEYAALIAEHYELADDREKARAWYQHAGDQAADTYANAESIRCLTHCLDLWPEEDIAGKYALLLKRVRGYDIVADRQAQKQDLETLQALAERLDKQETVDVRSKVSRRAQVFLQWWHFNDAIGDFKASTASIQQVITLAQAYGDQESEALGNLYFGVTLWRQPDYPAAQQYISQALTVARAMQSRSLEGDCLRNLGIVMQFQGNYIQARTHYEDAMRIYHEIGSERGESMTLNSLGSLILEQGLYREALPYFERSLELKRKIGHRRAEHITLLNMGILADKLGNFLDALRYLGAVRQFTVETNDRDLEIDALNGLGLVALHLGDFAQAKSYLERALAMAREIGVEISECDALESLALLLHHMGDEQAAYPHIQAACALAEELNLPDRRVSSLTYAAHILLGLGRMDESDRNYREALEMAHQNGTIYQVIEVQTGLALVCLAKKLTAQAFGIVEEILERLGIEDQAGPEPSLYIDNTHLDGLNSPFKVLWVCTQVLQASHDQRAEPLLRAAYQLLQQQAVRLPAGPMQANYLEMIPAHRELCRLYEQLAGNPDGGSP
jgi:class 3 adenylate cyclase/tetratricopeptide (TPR) repeat protein